MRATAQQVETAQRIVALLTASHNDDYETTAALMRELTVVTAGDAISMMIGMLLGSMEQLAEEAEMTLDEWLIEYGASVAAADGLDL